MTDPTASVTAGTPLERDAALTALGQALAGAAAGGGELVVVEAAALGTSPLLVEAATRAADAGLQVASARASESERDLPFGVALQLFAPALATLDDAERAGVLRGAARLAAPLLDADPRALAAGELSVIHGLYWLASNLADRAPLALLIDNAHLADAPSLRLCVYLAQRIDELPLALVVAAPPGVHYAQTAYPRLYGA